MKHRIEDTEREKRDLVTVVSRLKEDGAQREGTSPFRAYQSAIFCACVSETALVSAIALSLPSYTSSLGQRNSMANEASGCLKCPPRCQVSVIPLTFAVTFAAPKYGVLCILVA